MAATAHSIPQSSPLPPTPAPSAGPVGSSALATCQAPDRSGVSIHPESVVARLPVEVEVAVPVRDFRVRNLLALELGVVVGSRWSHGDDLPLSAGEVQLAWLEFEVVANTLAARITRIA